MYHTFPCSQTDLFSVLKAYTIHNPQDGYCQAQAPIAAVLLMHMPAEQAFWCLVAICDKYVTGYFSPGLVSSILFSHSLLTSTAFSVAALLAPGELLWGLFT